MAPHRTASFTPPIAQLARKALFPAVIAGLAISLSADLAAQDQPAPFTVAATGEGFARLQAAVNSIGAGEGTILIAPGTYHQCAVQDGGAITYRAAQPGTAVLSGTACEGKAALVLKGRSAAVEGLVFANIRVPDKNGAGIRLQQGDLSVRQSWFRDSEQGILTHSDPTGSLRIDKSTFTRLGTCENEDGCAHSIYAGDYGLVEITRSRFEEGTGGHYVKSRTARTIVTDCSFDDSAGRGTNYMIDLPNGGTGAITYNWFVQGRDKENYSAFIAVGAEDAHFSSDGLMITGNDARFAAGVNRSSAFVADWTGDRIEISDNRLAGGIERLDLR